MATTTEEKDSGLDVKLLLTTLIAFRRGDFSARMPNDWTGVHGKIADTLNEIVDMAERTTGDFERVSRVVGKAGEVGTEGKLGDQAVVKDLAGTWEDLTGNVNSMASNLTAQVRNTAQPSPIPCCPPHILFSGHDPRRAWRPCLTQSYISGGTSNGS